jgi:hypothetical protein
LLTEQLGESLDSTVSRIFYAYRESVGRFTRKPPAGDRSVSQIAARLQLYTLSPSHFVDPANSRDLPDRNWGPEELLLNA